MNFSIKETPNQERMERINKVYEGVKKDYQKGISIKNITDKYGINNNQWYKTYAPLLKKEGVYRKQDKTNIGVRNVRRINNKRDGVRYIYTFYEEGKKRVRSSYNLQNLRRRIYNEGLEWIVIDNELYRKEWSVL